MCEEAANDYWKRAGRALRDFVTGDRPLFLRRSRESRRLRRVPTDVHVQSRHSKHRHYDGKRL